MSEPIFSVKAEPKGAHVPAFRIQSSVFERLKEIARQNGIPLHEVIRQMITFALEHMEGK